MESGGGACGPRRSHASDTPAPETAKIHNIAAVDDTPFERRRAAYTDADGREYVIDEERKPAGAGYTVTSRSRPVLGYFESPPPIMCRGPVGGNHVMVDGPIDAMVVRSCPSGPDCWRTQDERAHREHPLTRRLAPGLKIPDGYRLIRDVGCGEPDPDAERKVHDAAMRDMRWTARGSHRDDLDHLHDVTCADPACPAQEPGYSERASIYGDLPHLARRG